MPQDGSESPPGLGISGPSGVRATPLTPLTPQEEQTASELIDSLADKAGSDNAAAASADEVLCAIFQHRDRTAIRSREEILRRLAVPLRFRQQVIHRKVIARGGGASQPAASQHTVAEWETWLEDRP